MCDDLLKKAFNELMGIELDGYTPINEGLSPAKKYHVWAGEKQYLLKITPEALNLQKYKVLREMYFAGIPVVAAINWKFYVEDKMTVLVYNWIPGKNLDAILEKCSESEKQYYGRKTAELIKQMHLFDINEFVEKKNPYALFVRYNFCLMRYRANFPYMREINKYIKKRKRIWKHCERLAFTHQDLRPENILVHQDQLYLIDFETASFADPYSDFVFFVSMQPNYQLEYSYALINAYFENTIPEDFWQWTFFYGAMAVQKYAIWKYRVKRKKVKLQAIHFYELYSGLTSVIPVFWRNKNDTQFNSKNR